MRVYTEKQRQENIDRASQWNRENRERRRKQNCNSPEYLRRLRYGLSPEKYQEMYDEQKGLCKMPSCGNPIEIVDHDHEINEIRALLCKSCNSALGLFRENPILMRDAADYIEYYRAVGGTPIVIPSKMRPGEHSKGNSYRRGSHFSEESKLKLSESLKETYRSGRKTWNTGLPWSEEARSKMSASAKRRHEKERLTRETQL
jgi:hypothetical protein